MLNHFILIVSYRICKRQYHILSFLARDSIMCHSGIWYCPSVRPSITRVDQSKTVEVRIMHLASQSSLWLYLPHF